MDAIGIRLDSKDTSRAINEIQNPITYIDTKTGVILKTTGYIQNLRVKVDDRGISINGSLAKFLFGNNLRTPTRIEIQRAIEILSDLLSLHLDQARIFKLEFGINIHIDKPMINYYDCLGEMRYFKKTCYDKETVQYKNINNAFVFYDKIKEMRKNRVPIPDIFRNKLIMRIESRLNKRLCQTLKEPKIKVSMLYEEIFYIKIIDLFRNQFDSIHRIRKIKLNSEVLQMATVKDFVNQLAFLQIIELGGEKEVLQMLEKEKNNFYCRQTFYMLKKKTKELSSQPVLTEDSESMLELNRKVKQALANYR